MSITFRYGLRWPGDEAALAALSKEPAGRLVQEFGAREAPHRFIEGDNLPVLRLLAREGLIGQIRVMYFDPPYNTGVAMRYRDQFATDLRAYERSNGVGAWGNRHADWLSMMAPRLAAAHALLAPDGVLFISIDDRETHHLRLLLDGVFGEENFVSTVVWRKKVVRGRGARHVLPQTEYIHVYAKDIRHLPPFAEPLTDAMRSAYAHADARGPYKLIPLAKSGTAHSARPNLIYDITAPDGSTIPCPTHQWRWSRETLAARTAEVVYKQGRDGRWRVFTKQYRDLPDGERERTPISYYDRHTTSDGTAELKGLFGRPVIDFPKPVGLIKDLLTWAIPRGEAGQPVWVLDAFAGSCPTAQAVLELNAEDGGQRRFLCIQQPEPLDDPEFATIAEVGKGRIRRIAERLQQTQTVAFLRHEGASQAD